MRTINLIVVHCSATRCDRPFPVTALIRCHADRFGFTGYHYYITRNGRTYQTRHEQLIGAHAKGYNEHSLGVCYEGGLNKQQTREACRHKDKSTEASSAEAAETTEEGTPTGSDSRSQRLA